MQIDPIGRTIPDVTHHRVSVNDVDLHYVAAGDAGSPILLVHGFPESWWAFHKLIPLLAQHHRVFAVDLRGFGDSGLASGEDGSRTTADDLHAVIERLDVGPVHLVVQDISGTAGFRLAKTHPGDLLSLTAVETGVAGFGMEALADVAKGGAWYIGVLATPGAPDVFFRGREQELIGDFIMKFATAVPDAATEDDLAELARGYAREGGWSGALALYGSMLREGQEIAGLATGRPLGMPIMAIDHAGSDFTRQSFANLSPKIRAETIEGVGHYIALEAPDALAAKLLDFAGEIDRAA